MGMVPPRAPGLPVPVNRDPYRFETAARPDLDLHYVVGVLIFIALFLGAMRWWDHYTEAQLLAVTTEEPDAP